MLGVRFEAGRIKSQAENLTRIGGIDQGIAVAASGSVLGVEPTVIIGTSLFDALDQFRGNRLPCALIFFEIGTMHCLHGGIAFHHANACAGPTEGEVWIEAL